MNDHKKVVVRRRAGDDRQTRLVTIDGQRIDELRSSGPQDSVLDIIERASKDFLEACNRSTLIHSTIKRRADQNDVFADTARYFAQVAKDLREQKLTDSPFGRIVQPPGTGKTVIMGEIVAATAASALILVPSRTLVDQHRKSLERQLPTVEIGVWSGEEKNVRPRGVTIATYQMLQQAFKDGRVPPELRNVAMVFADEAHEAMTGQRMATLREAFHPATVRLAFTATPDYDAKRTLATCFPTLVHEITMHEAVKLELLSDLLVWAVYVDSDASEVKMVRGDYDEADMARIMSAAPFFEACRKYRYDENGNAQVPTLICCRTQQQAFDLTSYLEKFRPKGAPKPEVILGTTSRDERKRILAQFDAGKIDTIVNVGVLLRGWDAPRCKLLIDLSPSCSMVRAKQKIFRPMRKFEGQVARLYMLLPQNLPTTPIFPSDFFGKSIDVSLAGEPPTKPSREQKPSGAEKTRTKVKSVNVVANMSMDGVRANPDLHPGNLAQVRQVIGQAYNVVHCTPTYKRFRELSFDNELFTGPGIALLRYCGVRDQRGYFAFMERLYPGAAAMRYFPPKEREEFKEKWCDEDVARMLESLHYVQEFSRGSREDYFMGWRALFGEDEFDSEGPEELVLRSMDIDLARSLLEELSERHRHVIDHRFGLGEIEEHTLEEIGKNLSLSRERVRKLEVEALGRMHGVYETKRMTTYEIYQRFLAEQLDLYVVAPDREDQPSTDTIHLPNNFFDRLVEYRRLRHEENQARLAEMRLEDPQRYSTVIQYYPPIPWENSYEYRSLMEMCP